MILKIFIYIILINSILFGIVVQENGNDQQKQEILRLKQELNEFYNLKEKEYQDRKAELEELLVKVEKTKQETLDIKNQNQAILDDIRAEVATKTTSIYNTMKPKTAAEIFDKMIAEGKIQDVFDIIVTLKTKTVTDILKYLALDNAAALTKMMQDSAKVTN